MKNLKAILLIILGSFFIATGFAFAGDTALSQAGNPTLWKGAAPTPAVTAGAPAAPAVTAAAPAPAPAQTTIGQDIKKWVGDHETQIVMGALGAYIGFALFGTLLGACTCGLGFLLFVGMMNM